MLETKLLSNSVTAISGTEKDPTLSATSMLDALKDRVTTGKN
jgi:hypothetical protein